MRTDRPVVLQDGSVWCVGDWFRAIDTLHMDGRTFTGEIVAVFVSWGRYSIMFDNGDGPGIMAAEALGAAVRL